jgi:hypothetical protein
MNEHVRPDKDPRDRLAAEDSKTTIDPITGAPTGAPAENNVYNAVETRPGRSGWPVLVVLAAGLILALIAWYPAEVATQSDTATQPAATENTTTDQASPPAATTDSGTVPATGTQPTTGTTPSETVPTTVTPPATDGTATQPTTGTTPTDTVPTTNGQGNPSSTGQ